MNSVIWVPLVVAVAFALLRKLVPAKPQRAPVVLTTADRAAFRKWEIAALLPIFLFTTALTGLWYFIIKSVAAFFLPSAQAAQFLIVPDRAYWLLPALFLAIVTAAVPTDVLYRRLLGSRYAGYEQYILERVGFDAWAVLRGLAVFVALGATIALVCGVNSATRFTTEGIEIGRPFSVNRSQYRYAQVARILHRATFVAPNGNTVHRPHYVIEFSDGSTWSTRATLRDPKPQLDEALARFVAARSGRTIEDVP